MAGPEERLKAPYRKFWSAGEEDIHGSGTRSRLARKAQLRDSRRIAIRRGPNPAPITNRQGSNPASGCLAELFLKFRLDALLLEARQVVDEDLSLEVIHFVLAADREDFLCGEGEGLSVQAERAHGHALGALNRLVDSCNRQAALLAILE